MLCSSAALLLLLGCGDEDSSEPDAGGSAADAMPGAPDATASAADAMLAAPDAAAAVVRFDDVHPIFAAKCEPCHTVGSLGGHSIGHDTIATAFASSQQNAGGGAGTVGAYSLVRIQNGTMPAGRGCSGDPAMDSGNAQCLTQVEQDLIQAWLDDGQLAPL